ncbi:MAG: beta-ketoacyl synthase N-terminal-like domain-containing protein, partial [Thermomicrobiales bacterium]
MRRRVVVTGMGGVSAIGNSVAQMWASAIAGVSGIARITRFDPEGYETTFAGEVKDFDAGAIVGRKEMRRMDRYSHFAVSAAIEARAMAGLEADDVVDKTRVGVLIGTAMGGAETAELATEALLAGGPRRVSPFAVPAML